MDNMQKAIAEKLAPMSAKEARDAINNGDFYIPETYHAFAWDIVAAKEADERSANEACSLSIAKDANTIARSALRNSIWANIIAIIATIIAVTAIIIAWLTRN